MKKLITWFIVTGIATLGIFLSLLSFIALKVPSNKEINSCFYTQMHNVYFCPTDSSYIPFNDISDFLKKTTLIAEDASFYLHSGFDWYEIKNSIFTNLKKRRFARGGSTLTQQLAKNLFFGSNKTLVRKFMEAFVTLKLEHLYSKNEILERYLNIVQFGPQVFGIRQAADFYFHKTPKELSLLESAFLSHLLPNPGDYSKSFLKGTLSDFSQSRILQICETLYRFKKISLEEFNSIRVNVPQFGHHIYNHSSPENIEKQSPEASQ